MQNWGTRHVLWSALDLASTQSMQFQVECIRCWNEHVSVPEIRTVWWWCAMWLVPCQIQYASIETCNNISDFPPHRDKQQTDSQYGFARSHPSLNTFMQINLPSSCVSRYCAGMNMLSTIARLKSCNFKCYYIIDIQQSMASFQPKQIFLILYNYNYKWPHLLHPKDRKEVLQNFPA